MSATVWGRAQPSTGRSQRSAAAIAASEAAAWSGWPVTPEAGSKTRMPSGRVLLDVPVDVRGEDGRVHRGQPAVGVGQRGGGRHADHLAGRRELVGAHGGEVVGVGPEGRGLAARQAEHGDVGAVLHEAVEEGAEREGLVVGVRDDDEHALPVRRPGAGGHGTHSGTQIWRRAAARRVSAATASTSTVVPPSSSTATTS